MSYNTEIEWKICIMRNPRSILQIPENERTEKLLTLALSKDSMLLGQLETSQLPKEARKAAIRAEPSVITLLSNPSVGEQLIAVRSNGMLLGYIPHPSEPVQIEAVRQNPAAIQFVHNPTDELLRKLIAANSKVLYYLPNPSEEIIQYGLSLSGLNIRYLSPLMETKDIILKALESKEREEVIRYFNEVHGGLFWFGRHFKQAINDAMQLNISIPTINNLLSATLKNKDLEFHTVQLFNPWGKNKDKTAHFACLHIGLNIHSECLELEGKPVRDFFNSIQGMECEEQSYELFQCKHRLESQIGF